MKRFRMPKWFIAGKDEPTQEETIEPSHPHTHQIHTPVVEESPRKPRRLANRRLLLVRCKDVQKFYMVGRRLQVLCINAEYRDDLTEAEKDWFVIGMVVEQPANKLMIYDGTVFSMAGLDIEEKFSELRKKFPSYHFDNIHMTLSKKEE